jgi:hypothetical protein
MLVMDRAHAIRRRTGRMLRSLARDRDGATIIEFAFALPLFMTLGLFGMDIANMASTSTQISQMALSVADNASRLGQTDNSAVSPTVMETDIDAVMYGAIQQGGGTDFENNAKIILTSFERDTATGKQYIHWQRCAGKLVRASVYGNDTNKNGLSGTPLTGIGKTGHRVSVPATPAGQAIMFVEVYYRYTPLLSGLYINNSDVEFRQEAAVLVRDDRNLSGGLSGTKKSAC